jgi:uncharacterized membrane protein YbhN (UPF0104 family)
MQAKTRHWWPVAKAALSAAILGLIGWRFVHDLSAPELYQQPLALHWLAPAGLFYLGGLTFSALYWRRLMRHLGEPAPLPAALRAYFVGQLGKYVPGKALALVMRAGLMRGAGTSAGLAGLSAFYEVLVTMAAGAILALLLFVLTDPRGVIGGRAEALADVVRLTMPADGRIDRLTLVLLSLALCCAILALVYPVVLNRLVRRVTILFRLGEPVKLRTAWLGEGLLMTAPCWLLFGLALACALHAVPGAGLGWSPATLAYLTAVMALAYVAGFLVPVAPGGLGVREFFLLALLAGELAARHDIPAERARGQVVLAVLLLRLAWTAAELLLAGVLYFLPMPGLNRIARAANETVDAGTRPPGQEQVA